MSARRKVLVVEDDPDICDAMAEALEDAGYEVSVAVNGAVALATLQAATELPFLILLDLMMPVMNGEHFLRELRNDPRLAGLPVVLCTAHNVVMAEAMGANGELRKPVQLDALLSTVAKYREVAA